MGWIGQAEVRIYDEFTRGFRRRDSVYDTPRRKMPHKEFDNPSDASNTTHWSCSVRVASDEFSVAVSPFTVFIDIAKLGNLRLIYLCNGDTLFPCGVRGTRLA
jgi:hypothetical protein